MLINSQFSFKTEYLEKYSRLYQDLIADCKDVSTLEFPNLLDKFCDQDFIDLEKYIDKCDFRILTGHWDPINIDSYDLNKNATIIDLSIALDMGPVTTIILHVSTKELFAKYAERIDVLQAFLESYDTVPPYIIMRQYLECKKSMFLNKHMEAFIEAEGKSGNKSKMILLHIETYDTICFKLVRKYHHCFPIKTDKIITLCRYDADGLKFPIDGSCRDEDCKYVAELLHQFLSLRYIYYVETEKGVGVIDLAEQQDENNFSHGMFEDILDINILSTDRRYIVARENDNLYTFVPGTRLGHYIKYVDT